MFKTDVQAIAVFGVKSKFGGGRSSGFALIYSNVDARKKFDSKLSLKRDALVKITGPKRK